MCVDRVESVENVCREGRVWRMCVEKAESVENVENVCREGRECRECV